MKRFDCGRRLAALLLALPLAISLVACASPVDEADDGSAPVEVDAGEADAADDSAPVDEGEAVPPAADLLGCAAFVEDEYLYIAAADVAAALDDESCLQDEIVFVDARPSLDYQSGHIPDAVNAPYHSVAGYVNELPKDKWLVIYCECPHAEAVQAARALTDELGYTKVKVIDEGLGGWRELGREIVGSVETSN